MSASDSGYEGDFATNPGLVTGPPPPDPYLADFSDTSAKERHRQYTSDSGNMGDCSGTAASDAATAVRRGTAARSKRRRPHRHSDSLAAGNNTASGGSVRFALTAAFGGTTGQGLAGSAAGTVAVMPWQAGTSQTRLQQSSDGLRPKERLAVAIPSSGGNASRLRVDDPLVPPALPRALSMLRSHEHSQYQHHSQQGGSAPAPSLTSKKASEGIASARDTPGPSSTAHAAAHSQGRPTADSGDPVSSGLSAPEASESMLATAQPATTQISPQSKTGTSKRLRLRRSVRVRGHQGQEPLPLSRPAEVRERAAAATGGGGTASAMSGWDADESDDESMWENEGVDGEVDDEDASYEGDGEGEGGDGSSAQREEVESFHPEYVPERADRAAGYEPSDAEDQDEGDA